MRFQVCIPRILKHEGGFVNHPRDPGGATNKGITLATFRRYIKPGATVADLKAMTQAQAVTIYKRHYWDAVCADQLPVGVDYAVADFAVNSGPHRAATYLQRVLEVPQDGRIGPKTIAAAKARDAAQVVALLCHERLAFMQRIVGSDGKRLWLTFGDGWMRRVDDVRNDAMRDIMDASKRGDVVNPLTSKPVDVNETAKSEHQSLLARLLAWFMEARQ